MTPDRFVVLGGGGEAAAPVTAQPVLTAAARHAARAAARRYKGDTWLVADRATCPVTCQLRGKVTRVRDGKLANAHKLYFSMKPVLKSIRAMCWPGPVPKLT